MTYTVSAMNSFSSRSYLFFQVFKYSIYLLLCYNVWLFFESELAASSATFRDGIALNEVIQAYAASIDTASWVILLLIFELETYIISDEKLKGSLKWLFLFFKILCYSFIIYSAYGYISKLLFLTDNSVFTKNVCQLVGTSFSTLITLDEYMPINDVACQSMVTETLYRINGTEIITTQSNLMDAKILAWIDIINAVDWLLIVVILEIDVYLQLKGKFTGKFKKTSQLIKPFLYLVLIICAIYWGLHGSFVDFWDAFLWLLAFFFIEMNLFEWQEETTNNQINKDQTVDAVQ